MNSCDFIGYLTRDPEIRYTQNDNLCVARFTLAVDRKFKSDNGPSVDYLQFKALGKKGEFAEKYLKKGQQVGVECRAASGSYDKNGEKVYYTEFIVEDYTFCGKKDGNSNGSGNQPGSSGDGFMNIPEGYDEELPFN